MADKNSNTKIDKNVERFSTQPVTIEKLKKMVQEIKERNEYFDKVSKVDYSKLSVPFSI